MISVIIPIYRTKEELLARCVRSIENQSYKDIEVLPVFNGCDKEYIARTSKLFVNLRFQAIVLDKKGVSIARNAGMKAACGEYIVFVDADDEMIENFLDEALKTAMKTGADVVASGACYRFDEHDVILSAPFEKMMMLNGIDVCHELLNPSGSLLKPQNAVFLSSVSGKLFKKEIFQKVAFDEEVGFYEDMLFDFEVFSAGATAAIVPGYWYIYYQYADSALHTVNDSILPSIEKVTYRIDQRIREMQKEDVFLYDFGQFNLNFAGFCVRAASSGKVYKKHMEICETNALYKASLRMRLKDIRKFRRNVFGIAICFSMYKSVYRISKLRRFFKKIIFRGKSGK